MIRKFRLRGLDQKKLNSDELKILPLLIEAAEKLDEVYKLQENGKFEGNNFYPADITKKEIEEAAKEKPAIFSPYTIVERKTNGTLEPVDYHIKYANLLKPISKSLLKASKMSKNETFKKYLETLSSSLINGDYASADIAWLFTVNSNIDFTLGPYERNLDKLYFVKRAYQANVGIVDQEATKKAQTVRDILYRNVDTAHQRIVPPSIVDVSAEHNIISSGFLGKLLFSQQHLPSDPEITQRLGSRVIGYLSTIDYKFEKLIYPIFKEIFAESFRQRYTEETLSSGNYYFVFLQAFAQQLHRYPNSRERLKELFPIFDEANSVVSGIQHAKHLVLKGYIDQKKLESIMIAHICWIFSEWILNREAKTRESYLKGDALTLNFLIREGALLEKDGISWPNFAKMFFEIENLSSLFVRYLEQGSYWEAQEFLSKYLSYSPFKSFEKRLAKVKSL